MYKPDPNKPDVDSQSKASRRRSPTLSLAARTAKYSNEYDLSGGSDNNWTLTMKPLFENDLEKQTVDQAIETIRDRVDALGVSEPLIQSTAWAQTRFWWSCPASATWTR